MLTSASKTILMTLKICVFNALEIEIFEFFNEFFLNLEYLKSDQRYSLAKP